MALSCALKLYLPTTVLIIVLCLQSTFSTTCPELTISCNTGAASCYNAACSSMASHLNNINHLRSHISITPHPTKSPVAAPTPKPTAKPISYPQLEIPYKPLSQTGTNSNEQDTNELPTFLPTDEPTPIPTPNPTPFPTSSLLSGEIMCGSTKSGFFKNEPISLLVRMSDFRGDLTVDAGSSMGFTIARIVAYNLRAPQQAIAEINWDPELTVRNVPAGDDIIFHVHGMGNGIYVVETECDQQQHSQFLSISTTSTSTTTKSPVVRSNSGTYTHYNAPIYTSSAAETTESTEIEYGESTSTTEYEATEPTESTEPTEPSEATEPTEVEQAEPEEEEVVIAVDRGGDSSSDDAMVNEEERVDGGLDYEMTRNVNEGREQEKHFRALVSWTMFFVVLFSVLGTLYYVYYKVCWVGKLQRAMYESQFKEAASCAEQIGCAGGNNMSGYDADEWSEFDDSDDSPSRSY